MATSSERSELELFLEEIGETTELEVCLFDFKSFTKDALELQVDSNRRIHACEYCRVVKSNKKAWKRCIETEHRRAEVASSKEERFRHTCYAGVTDLVVPLKRGPQLVGALYLGQVQCQSDLEREVGMSNSQFSRVFYEETGMTFRECLMQVRLEVAGYLLERSRTGP